MAQSKNFVVRMASKSLFLEFLDFVLAASSSQGSTNITDYSKYVTIRSSQFANWLRRLGRHFITKK